MNARQVTLLGNLTVIDNSFALSLNFENLQTEKSKIDTKLAKLQKEIDLLEDLKKTIKQ